MSVLRSIRKHRQGVESYNLWLTFLTDSVIIIMESVFCVEVFGQSLRDSLLATYKKLKKEEWVIGLAKEIPLTKGVIAIVDDEDFEWLIQWKWRGSGRYAESSRYMKDTKKYKTFLMHRVIMNAPQNLEVDHINGNKLDNRKENLRICSRKENSRNKRMKEQGQSIYKGVTPDKRGKRIKWRAIIKVDDKAISIGVFSNELAAAMAYNEAAVQYFGEFAYLNDVSLDNWGIYQLKNSSIYSGVSWSAKDNRWRTTFYHKEIKRQYGLGNHISEEEAAIAYDKEALEMYGDKAKLNFPERKEGYLDVCKLA